MSQPDRAVDESPRPALPTPQSQEREGDAASSASILTLELTTLGLSAPLAWLRLGWSDFKRCPGIGLFYGLCFVGMGWALLALFQSAPEYLLALSAGFLLLGPFLCLGLYDASKALQSHNRSPTLHASWTAWYPARGTMAIFAGALLILEMLWARAALVVFAVSFNTTPDNGQVWSMLLDPENWGFLVTYTVVGGVFAGLIFVASVIAIPMILDRQVDAISAALTSMRACVQNPAVMLLWGALITGMVVLAMLPLFLGLLVVGPVIGHATWHAYRHIVPTPEGKP